MDLDTVIDDLDNVDTQMDCAREELYDHGYYMAKVFLANAQAQLHDLRKKLDEERAERVA